MTFNKEARERFLGFATGLDAAWTGNFRDLNAAVTRMATFAAGGRVTVEIVDAEIRRLKAAWAVDPGSEGCAELEGFVDPEALLKIDPFDRVQLTEVVRICQSSQSLSEAGRRLFAVSRTKKGTANDADRLRKYLARFGLEWRRLKGG